MRNTLIFAIFISINLNYVMTVKATETPSHYTPFFNPFSLVIDPMERLLLINFEQDPDSLYVGFEPQFFDDAVNGKGLLVIGWRADGRVDVYHQPSLSPDPTTYDIAGKGLANMIMREMEHDRFEIDERGVQAGIVFYDIHNRIITLRIEENSSKKRKPFGLLAPMGDAAENPSAMPLVLLHDFYFVRQKDTRICIRINDKEHTPDKLPIPMDWQRMLFTRYSPDPFIVTLNPASEGILEPVQLRGESVIQRKNGQWHFLYADGQAFLEKITSGDDRNQIDLSFSPGFPNSYTIADGSEVKGKFRISGHPSTGSISGEYRIARQGDKVLISMVPTGGWKPVPNKLSLRFLYRVAKIFRNWPKTYHYNATLILDQETAKISSHWERIR